MGANGSTDGFAKNIRARAVCGCGSDEFHVFAFSCGHDRAACIACGEFWEAPWAAVGGGSAVLPKRDEAVGEGGDVAADVVSSAERPVTLADLRHLKRMQLWLAANPDWDGEKP